MIALRPIIDLHKLFTVRWPAIEWNINAGIRRNRAAHVDSQPVKLQAHITSPRLDAPSLSFPGSGNSAIGQVPLLMRSGGR